MRLLAASLCSCVAAVALSVSSADAAPPAKTAKGKPHEEPPAPPSPVTLTIVSPSPTSPWTMRLENTGEVPVRVVADAHLLSFEITPKAAEPPPEKTPTKGAKKPKAPREPAKIKCVLPAEMRPSNDVGRALVLPPKRAYEETFDPYLYCFGARESAALVADAAVVAHFGWTTTAKAAPSAPFAISGLEGVEPKVASYKAIDSTPWTLPPEPNAPTPPPLPTSSQSEEEATYPVKLAVTTPARLDVADARQIPITVSVANDGPRATTFAFAPPTIGFDVIGVAGAVHCSWTAHAGGMPRELLTTLAPKHRTSLAVLLQEICPDGTFDRVGIYDVRPRLETQGAAGASPGVRTFEGDVVGQDTTRLRVRRSDAGDIRERPTLAPH